MSDAAYRIVMAKRVAKDVEGIFDHIAKDSPGVACGVIERILNAIETLGTLPHRTIVEGQASSSKPPVRSLPVRSWVVYFRVLDADRVVRILRVRHGSRRPLKRYD